jgi:hypothetical protein
MIQSVEEFPAELESRPLRQTKVADQRQIQRLRARPIN